MDLRMSRWHSFLGIMQKGFEIVPISQLIHRENFEMDHEGRQIPKGKDV